MIQERKAGFQVHRDMQWDLPRVYLTKIECMPMIHRRRFLATTAAAAFSFHLVPRSVLGGPGHKPPSEKLNLAGIGVGGQGASDLRDMAGENIVALCDVDWKFAARTFKTYPKAAVFKDYRLLLEKRKDIDAVVIATPDHMHAPITLAALRAGKHVYVEKPWPIASRRPVSWLAWPRDRPRDAGGQLRPRRRRLALDPRVDPGRGDRPGPRSPLLDRPAGQLVEARSTAAHRMPARACRLRLGSLARRRAPAAVPSGVLSLCWRGWFDFGTGALGDMAIHNMDPAFYALDLAAPTAVEPQTSPLKKESYPAWQMLTYEFAAKGDRPAVKLTWYDGGKMPPAPGRARAGPPS